MIPVGSIKYSDLVDISELQALIESFSQVVGVANAVVDVDGVVIVHAGQQDVCRAFHRLNAETCRRCIESDAFLVDGLRRGAAFEKHQCQNGLLDTASPVIVEGEHVANVFSGQFLTEPPDLNFFRQQARRFGFDEAGYLDAIARVPVVPQERVESVTRLCAQLAGMLANSALDCLRERQAAEKLANLNKVLEEKVAERTLALARANEGLVGREALLKQILDTSSVAIFVVDPEGRITQANQCMAEMFGCTLDALMGYEYADLVHPSELEVGRQKMLALLASAVASVDLERRYWRTDHTEFWGHLTGKRFGGPNGEERGLVGVIADITLRKSMEEKLLRQNAMLSAIIENFPGAISVFDADFRLAAHNDQFRQLLDLPDSLFEPPDLYFEDVIRFNAGRGEYGPGDTEQQVAAIVARARNSIST